MAQRGNNSNSSGSNGISSEYSLSISKPTRMIRKIQVKLGLGQTLLDSKRMLISLLGQVSKAEHQRIVDLDIQ